jgi:hypothetical protein
MKLVHLACAVALGAGALGTGCLASAETTTPTEDLVLVEETIADSSPDFVRPFFVIPPFHRPFRIPPHGPYRLPFGNPYHGPYRITSGASTTEAAPLPAPAVNLEDSAR